MHDKPLKNKLPIFRHQHICPWWLCFTFDNFLRRLFQNPENILKPYIRKGWKVLDVGPGMGYFTIPLAKLVGDTGRVIAADLQKKMLDNILDKARRAGVENRIELQQSNRDSIGLKEPIDFCLAFWMLHEVADTPRFLGEIADNLKQNGLLLLVEPKFHVSKKKFDRALWVANNKGLISLYHPKIFMSYSILLKK